MAFVLSSSVKTDLSLTVLSLGGSFFVFFDMSLKYTFSGLVLSRNYVFQYSNIFSDLHLAVCFFELLTGSEHPAWTNQVFFVNG